MRPHADDFHEILALVHGIDKTMLDVDAPGVKPHEIADFHMKAGSEKNLFSPAP